MRYWVKTVQVLRYRMKGDSEILAVRVDSLEVKTTPTNWNAKGEPTEWHVDLFINSWQILPVHDLTDWHEFITMPASEWDAIEGEVLSREVSDAA